MHPFERYMKVLKSYVGSRKYPEGCIVQRYLAEEEIEFCSEYLNGLDPVGIPQSNRDPKANIPMESIMGRKKEGGKPTVEELQGLNADKLHGVTDAELHELTNEERHVDVQKNKRGPTLMGKLTVATRWRKKAKIDYDNMGRPTYNANGRALQSYIDSIARSMVSINIKSWPDVPENIKQKVWEEISNVFELVPQSEYTVMSSTAQKWRILQPKKLVKYKHQWSIIEDAALIEALMQLNNAGDLRNKNEKVFRPGHGLKLQQMLDVSLPRHGIKAKPHIESRLRTFQKLHNVVHDMLYGVGTNGFDVEQFIYKSLVYYEEFSVFFGGERASGKDAQGPTDIVEELDKVAVENDESIGVDGGLCFICPRFHIWIKRREF
ncbi:hypothetical protein ZIOFF_025378 [Zingiber officinale]|uniref:DUF4218 domain-containing protein n=1 Tax=Zingiber officinale TaxID=94328 RepID=A0A8J5HE57_ZINOF|nr:hypothetical protein ZIOFF_025378 [Zingiber officinale]